MACGVAKLSSLNSIWNRVYGNPICRIPRGVVEFDGQIWKVFLHGCLHSSEVLLLALARFRGIVQVSRHGFVPCAVLMLNQDEPPDCVFLHEEP